MYLSTQYLNQKEIACHYTKVHNTKLHNIPLHYLVFDVRHPYIVHFFNESQVSQCLFGVAEGVALDLRGGVIAVLVQCPASHSVSSSTAHKAAGEHHYKYM